MKQTASKKSAATFANADPDALIVEVLAEQIRQLISKRIDLPVNVILAAILSVSLWREFATWVIIPWLALFVFVILCRYLLRRRYVTTAPPASAARLWARRATWGAFVTACMWGVTGLVVVVTSNPIYQVFIVFMLGGMAAGGVVSHAAYLPTMLAFALPTILPVAVALLTLGSAMQIEMGVMLLIFTVTLVVSGFDINRTIIENLRTRVGQGLLLAKLRTSEAAMADAQRLGKIGSWETDLEGHFGTCSAEAYRIIGVDPATFKPSFEAILARVHPDDRDVVSLETAKQNAAGMNQGVDFRLVMDDGSIKYVHGFAQAIADTDGQPERIYGILQDVTERKLVENALQFANTLLMSEMEASPDGILVVDSNRKIVSFNQRFAAMWNVPLSDLTAGYDPRVLDRVVSLIKDGDAFRARVEYLFKHPEEQAFEEYETTDGRFIERHTASLSSPNDPNLGRVWYFRDITERKRAAMSLAYRDNVLHAMTLCTARLVAGQTLEGSLPGALKTLAEALQVDRTVVFKRPRAERDMTIVASWQRDDVPELGPGVLPIVAGNSREIDAWFAPLTEGKPVVTFTDNATGVVARILRSMNVRSNLLVPIAVAGDYWGHIGIDDCRTARQWSPVEIDSLATLAEIIGTLLLREQMNTLIETNEKRFRAVTETAQDGIITMDAAAKVTYWNPAAERIIGYTADEAIGKDVHQWLAPERYRERAAVGMKEFAATGRGEVLGKTLEFAAIRKDGTEFPIELSVSAIQKGTGWGAVAILRDITERKHAEEQLVRMARHDTLTGLANRGVFVEALQQGIARAHRGGKNFAVLYLDLDHFKDVNDTLGHPVGDLLLQSVAQRLEKTLREADTVARFGGDEFALIAIDIDEPSDAAVLADKVLKSIAEPYSIQGNEIRTGASVGIALYGPDSPDAELLLSHADVALYRAKAEGRGTYRFFTDAMDAEVRARVTLGVELRTAISSGQLFLEYQPQVNADTNGIIGLEALVRWNHPIRGLVPPTELIPVAEKIGLIVELGSWVLREACRQMKAWLDDGIAPPLIAVNVSALQFKKQFELEEDISEILAATGLPAKLLELELTESVLMGASREHNDVLLRLHEAGLRIAIDDFGTGYSSLEYLGRFPVDRIKIAQNFMLDLTPGSANAKIVKAAISLAHDLGLDVIVEGVERKDQLELIRSWRGHKVQGYYYSRALSADDTPRVLAVGKIKPARQSGTHFTLNASDGG
ncbi:MAG: EAL domain-containing protein [Pseudolabrys sp.]